MTASGISFQAGIAEELYVNEVQQLSGTPSGTFGLNFDGALTITTLATNASAANVQAALEALPNIGTGNVACSGGPLPSAIIVTFSGSTVKQKNVPQLTVQGAVTGLTFATNTGGTGYGDPQTVTRFYETISESIENDIARIESAAIRAGSRALRTDRWAAGRQSAGGDFEVELWSKSQSMLLGQCFGIDPTITTPSGATLTRDHTFNVLANDNSGRSFTYQQGIPDVFGNVQPFTYTGGKVTDWQISIDAEGIGTLKVSPDFQRELNSVGLAVAAYAASVEVLYFTGASVQIAGANVDVTKVTVSGKMGYNTGRYFARANTTAGGPALKKEPIANDLIDIGLDIECEFESLAQYQRFTAGTMTSVVVQFNGTIIEAGGGATVNPRYGLGMTFANVRFDGKTPNVKGMDVTALSLPCKALTDGSANLMTAVYRTTDVAK